MNRFYLSLIVVISCNSIWYLKGLSEYSFNMPVPGCYEFFKNEIQTGPDGSKYLIRTRIDGIPEGYEPVLESESERIKRILEKHQIGLSGLLIGFIAEGIGLCNEYPLRKVINEKTADLNVELIRIRDDRKNQNIDQNPLKKEEAEVMIQMQAIEKCIRDEQTWKINKFFSRFRISVSLTSLITLYALYNDYMYEKRQIKDIVEISEKNKSE
jgi:hypothetical protein